MDRQRFSFAEPSKRQQEDPVRDYGTCYDMVPYVFLRTSPTDVKTLRGMLIHSRATVLTQESRGVEISARLAGEDGQTGSERELEETDGRIPDRLIQGVGFALPLFGCEQSSTHFVSM